MGNGMRCSGWRIFLMPSGNKGNNVERRQLGQSGCNQHLCPIGDNALYYARECVEYAGTFPLVYPVFFRYAAGEWTHCDDGNRIVGGTEIGKADEGGNAEFGSPFVVDAFGQPVQDIVDASIEPDEFQHTACHQRDDNQFPIPSTPSPIAPNHPKRSNVPYPHPMMPVDSKPKSNTSVTFIPAMEVPSTIR